MVLVSGASERVSERDSKTVSEGECYVGGERGCGKHIPVFWIKVFSFHTLVVDASV